MKHLITIVLSLSIFLIVPFPAKASTLFHDNALGSTGNQWIPNGWISKTTLGTFSNDGVTGPFDYFKDFNSTNLILKFDLNIHDATSNIVFSCRANSDYSDVEQGQLTGNGQPGAASISNATECISGNCSGTGTPNPYTWLQSVGKHQVELDCIGSTLTLKYDNDILTESSISNQEFGTGIRLYSSGGNNSYSNISVCNSAGCDNPTPTPSPTPTPTPTPEVNLNVPLIKQTSNPWQSQEYDTAQLWAPSSPTIGDWGCALTSATMVLQYNGIIKMPNDTILDPSSLNTWLKSQSDGYIGDGLVNWLAISRLSRLAKLAFNNPGYTADALEWKWIHGNSNSLISQDLHNNIPDILSEPGHFVVVKGTQGSTFAINDPAASKTLLTDYGNSFVYAGKFVPSHTDLSYILLTGPTDLSFDMKTATGSSIGESFIQQPITNDTNPSETNGLPIKIFYVEQPPTDSYQLTITGFNPQIYDVKAYDYDINGNVIATDIQGAIDSTHPNTITIPFDKNQNNNGQDKRQVTIPLLIFDLQSLYKQGLIKKIPYTLFSRIFTNVQKASDKKRVWEEKIILRIASVLLSAEKPMGISDKAYSLLSSDLTYLLSQ